MSSDNPYKPPKAPSVPAKPVTARPGRIPGTVIAALVMVTIITVVILVGVFSTPNSKAEDEQAPLVPLVISAVVLGGTLMRYPVAWHVSRGVASIAVLFGGLALVLGIFTGFGSESLLLWLTLGGSVGLNVAILWLMSTASARAWFGLGCPACGDLHPFAAKFGHSIARCRECGTLWEPRTGMLKAG